MLETIIGHLPERNLPDPVLEGNISIHSLKNIHVADVKWLTS